MPPNTYCPFRGSPRSNCKARPVTGIERLSPFFVTSSRIAPRSRSTCRQVTPNSSPRRQPVLMAVTTRGYKKRFLLARQAESSAARSSSDKNLTRGRDARGFLIFRTGLSSAYCHSMIATVKTWDSAARYLVTVAFDLPLASLSRCSTSRAGVISAIYRRPKCRCQ
jgi:hypothetical protein